MKMTHTVNYVDTGSNQVGVHTPTARLIVGDKTPGAVDKGSCKCPHCGLLGHEAYECPKLFAEAFPGAFLICVYVTRVYACIFVCVLMCVCFCVCRIRVGIHRNTCTYISSKSEKRNNLI